MPFHIPLTTNDGSNFYTGFPGGSVLKNLPAKAGDAGLIAGLEDSLEKEMATTPVFLPGKSHGQKSLAATVHGLAKESNTT